jgi:hypothetical protein
MWGRMYVCGDVCMCVGVYVCVWGVCTYVCGGVCRGVGVYVCMCVGMYACVCECIFIGTRGEKETESSKGNQ